MERTFSEILANLLIHWALALPALYWIAAWFHGDAK